MLFRSLGGHNRGQVSKLFLFPGEQLRIREDSSSGICAPLTLPQLAIAPCCCVEVANCNLMQRGAGWLKAALVFTVANGTVPYSFTIQPPFTIELFARSAAEIGGPAMASSTDKSRFLLSYGSTILNQRRGAPSRATQFSSIGMWSQNEEELPSSGRGTDTTALVVQDGVPRIENADRRLLFDSDEREAAVVHLRSVGLLRDPPPCGFAQGAYSLAVPLVGAQSVSLSPVLQLFVDLWLRGTSCEIWRMLQERKMRGPTQLPYLQGYWTGTAKARFVNERFQQETVTCDAALLVRDSIIERHLYGCPAAGKSSGIIEVDGTRLPAEFNFERVLWSAHSHNCRIYFVHSA